MIPSHLTYLPLAPHTQYTWVFLLELWASFHIIIKEIFLIDKSSNYSPVFRKNENLLQVSLNIKGMCYSKTSLMHSGYFLPEHLFDFQWNKPTLDSLWLEVTSFPFKGHRFSFLVLIMEVSFPSPSIILNFILVLGCCLLKVHHFIGFHIPP